MRRLLQLAALIFLLNGAAAMRAQIHFKPNKPQTDDLQWLWQYTKPAPAGNESALTQDPRFQAFLAQNLTAPQTFWSKDKTLADTALEFLGQPRSAVAVDNRYFIATGCVQEFRPNRGLLWVDLGLAHPLIVFAATNWNAEDKATDQQGAKYTLWIFSNRGLDADHLPSAFTRSVSPWLHEPIADGTVEQIATVLLIDPNGQPHQIPPATIANPMNPQQTEQKAHS